MERVWAMMPLVALAFVLAGAYVLVRRRRPHRARLKEIRCPHCGSTCWQRDSASPWTFLFAAALLPFSLVLFCLNRNVWCTGCGVRFKRPQSTL